METLPVATLHGVLGELVRPIPPAVIVLHGRRGSGKSTLALGSFARPYVVTAEMSPALVELYLHRLGQAHAGIDEAWLDAEASPAELHLGQGAERVRELVLDSATETGDEIAAVRACRAWARRRQGVAILVFQHTKDGQPRGSSAALHACDVEILVEELDGDRVIDVQKNRFGPTGSRTFRLESDGAAAPKRDRYYSVEGSGGAYRLVPWAGLATPTSRTCGRAGVLRFQEEQLAEEDGKPLPLPPPPRAVGASRSLLAPRGWIEPPDWEQRAAFAVAQGVPYWSPLEEESDG